MKKMDKKFIGDKKGSFEGLSYNWTDPIKLKLDFKCEANGGDLRLDCHGIEKINLYEGNATKVN